MPLIRVKGWAEFQHYKDRNPAWIKLHKRLLDDYEFHCLPDASRALAPMIWLLASESKDGSIDIDYGKLSFRLRMTEEKLTSALLPLINGGFLQMENDASTTLAGRKHDAMPEKRREEEETEREKRKNIRASALVVSPEGFNDFWNVCIRRVGRGAAIKAYVSAIKSGVEPAVILAAMRRHAEAMRGKEAQYIPHPATWLNQQRWTDEPDPPSRRQATLDVLNQIAQGATFNAD